MFITDIREDFSFDEVRGQISIDVNFGVLRKPDYAHILVGTNFSSSAEGKFPTENIIVYDSAEKNRKFHEKISRQNSQIMTSENSKRKLWTLHKKIADSSDFVGEEKRNFKSDLGDEIENVHARRNYSGDEEIIRDEIHKCAR